MNMNLCVKSGNNVEAFPTIVEVAQYIWRIKGICFQYKRKINGALILDMSIE